MACKKGLRSVPRPMDSPAHTLSFIPDLDTFNARTHLLRTLSVDGGDLSTASAKTQRNRVARTRIDVASR
ncbi:hypothetical protein Y032_0031g2410 [Ancylostoma ceylanicum]|uniref:Uncharacterized protein n=1 Tax=Ancylostoma ceylanicum TaxID=53326 RepID=A0A016UR72_9BILA|nr:hypothetical protein Y032_0031g2410 [Ancylostoma ceylanicum]